MKSKKQKGNSTTSLFTGFRINNDVIKTIR